MTTMIAPAPVVLTNEDIEQLPEVPLGPNRGVTHRVLWCDDTSTAGVMTVQAGARLGVHVHGANNHHIWVLRGHATILGRRLGPGAYAYEPSHVQHDIDASDTEGCTLFYVYMRPRGRATTGTCDRRD